MDEPLVIFIVAALTNGQAAALAASGPIGLALGLPPEFSVGHMWPVEDDLRWDARDECDKWASSDSV
jgi:hypothetical protein